MTETTFQGVTRDELGQAARNHAMHLEGLRYDVTPPGMHYLVIHWDIPAADEARWTVEVDGFVDRPLTLSLDDLRGRPAVTRPVTMECAGNGRALMP
nr:molybdopterin-dependent oxidoreductase [Actinomycetota bacterium]